MSAAPTPSDRVREMVAAMTLDEKAGLTAGVDFWSTLPVPHVGLPRVRVTDGPNGARGPVTRGEGGLRAVCVPCGTALGATWDVEQHADPDTADLAYSSKRALAELSRGDISQSTFRKRLRMFAAPVPCR